MARKSTATKYNESCVRIFDILKLFSKGTVDFADVINLFAYENGELTQNANVLLNKYLNTLKIFGVDFVKYQNVYYIKKMPFTFDFSKDELNAISIIMSYMTLIPNGKTKVALEEFVENLEKRFDDTTRQRKFSLNKSLENKELYVYFTKYEKIISEAYQACAEQKRVELSYQRGTKTITLIVNPKEIKYERDRISFSVFNNLSRQIVDIPMGKIISIKKLNSKCSDCSENYTTVVFKLKNTLAKRYKLRDYERLESKSQDGELTIVNSGEDFEALATRLLKYGENCVVVSPAELKTKIKETIEATLSNYEK